MKIETLAIHAGQPTDAATGAITPPIHPSTTFERDADGGYSRGLVYTRYGNPNRGALEHCLTALEGGVAAACFSSGMAAVMTVLQALEPGDHIVVPDDMYFGVRTLQREVFQRWGLEFSTVDMSSAAEVASAVRSETRLVWTESPSNPLLKITDLRAVADIAHAVGALCCTDNTCATPVLQRPFDHGVDLVLHSCTKYLSGHSDVLGGALITAADDDTFKRIRTLQMEGGAVPSPFDCWLTLRGIQTLPYRVRAQNQSALTVARALKAHPAVDAVYYPGLESHSGYALAMRQMSTGGALLSFLVKGGEDTAMAMAGRLRLIRRATSLGGTHTLIEHRRSVEGAESRAPANLLRLAVGLEHVDDVIADLEQALQRG